MATLAEIRAMLAASDNKSNFGNNQSSNEIYAFWNIPEGSTATVRFLPDGDPTNTFFWVERLIIKLPFEGIKGQDQGSESKSVTVQVPCVEMWGRTCPILSEARTWFKEPSLEALGKKYWKKRSYVFQGFVLSDPMNEKDVPENSIRRFVINSSIFKIIRASLMDPEMEEIPTDYQAGRDFKLTKTKRGGYADYSTSSWSMRTRALSDTEMTAINTHGLFNLKDYLPKEPSDKELEIIKEMFEASVNGEPYDSARWGSYYKPYGLQSAENNSNINISTTSTIATPVEVTPEEDLDTPPFEVEPIDDSTSSPVPSSPKAALTRLKQRVSQADDEIDSDEEETVSAGKSVSTDSKPDHKQILEMIKRRNKSS